LSEGCGDCDGARLEPVDQQADVPGEERDRRPECDQQDRDADAVPSLLGPERECEDGHPVADRRDGDRGSDDAKVARADRHPREYLGDVPTHVVNG